ncbi:MAG: hypothetical protein PWQ79_1393 [Thermococcaceae archaeon]|nr:hypothetical protein [Thermococcaceae archaeon]MDK2914478.1 hypothetical protein [Thermococcaceae archaeon]
MAILITKDGRIVSKAEESEFKNEGYLQTYILENPELIPLEEIHSEKRNFIVTIREFNTYSGPIDILAIDNKGDIYLIETKLSRNADKRKVIAQILDYAAAIWEEYTNNPEGFINKIEEDYEFEIPEDVAEGIIKNLSEGNFKLIVAMDSLDKRLKTMIRFLKSHSTFDLYALEFDYYEFKDESGELYEIFVPKLFGIETTEKKTSSSQSSRRKWSVEEFLDYVKNEIEPRNPSLASAILELSSKARELGWTLKPGTSKQGSLNLVPPGELTNGRAIFSFVGTGVLKVYLGWIIDETAKNELVNALLSSGLPIDGTKVEYHLRPDEWLPKVKEITSILERFSNY